MPAVSPRLLFAAALLAGAGAGATAEEEIGRSGAYTPLNVVRTTELAYPSRLITRYIDDGEARIMIMVDAGGQLVDWFVTGYTHPLFAKEALDALQKWKYQPATFQGQPILVRTEMQFVFSRTGMVRVIPSDMETSLRLQDGKHREVFQQKVCKMEELDTPLDTVVEIAPMPPDRLGALSSEGKVVVDYFIDAEGRVRMPLIVSSDDDAFSASVLLALSDWRYVTPTHEGKPVMARVWRQFNFRPIRVTEQETAAAAKPDRT